MESTVWASCSSCPSSNLQTGLFKKLSTSPPIIFETISSPLSRSIVLMFLARKCSAGSRSIPKNLATILPPKRPAAIPFKPPNAPPMPESNS